MKTYDQRMQAILKKARVQKITRACLKSVTSVLCIVAVIFGLMQFPYGSFRAAFTPTEPSNTPNSTNQHEPIIPTGTEGPPADDITTKPTQPSEPDGKEHISVTIWMPDEGMAKFTQEQIERFNQNNTMGIVIHATVEGVWRDDAANYVAADPENAPDLYCFRQDDLIRLANLNVLAPLSDADAQWVVENNLPFSVDAAMYDGQVYAFPVSYQNVTLLYYDRSVISDEDVTSLAKILSACKAADKKFCFEALNPESMLTFFLATGCNSQWYPDADGKYTQVVDTLNTVEGRFALMGLLDILNSPMRTTVMQNGMTSNIIMEEVYRQCGAVITSDLFSVGMLQEILGDNFGVTALPTFEQYDSEYQLHSLADSLMMGIKPQQDPRTAAALSELAKYLTGEECQLERYQGIYWMIPSNLSALAQLSEDEPFIAAMVKQSQYAVPNMLPHGTEWWDYATDIVARFENDLTAEMTLKLYAQRLEDLLDPPTGIWSVYDGLLDIDMIQQEDGTWRTKDPIYFSEMDGFIVRYEHSYDQACYQQSQFGYGYWKPGAAGYYHIFFDPVAWQCTWVLQSQQE